MTVAERAAGAATMPAMRALRLAERIIAATHGGGADAEVRELLTGDCRAAYWYGYAAASMRRVRQGRRKVQRCSGWCSPARRKRRAGEPYYLIPATDLQPAAADRHRRRKVCTACATAFVAARLAAPEASR